MFTGLVSCVGTIESLSDGRLSVVLSAEPWSDPIRVGESVAVNGCCLTVVAMADKRLSFDLSPETLSRTRFASQRLGDRVNLERALAVGDRLGGHFVQGHVDALGVFVRKSALENGAWTYEFELKHGGGKYLVDKGSIAIDGVSLTVVEPLGDRFSVAVIPHTHAHTNLCGLTEGESVHIEYDVLAKHVEKLLANLS